MHAVELTQVSRFYGQRAAVHEASFSVPRGSLFGLIGPNGAGKSTCLGMVTTLLAPSAGRVAVCGLDVTVETSEARRRIGYAPEEPLIYAGLTAREFVELAGRLHGMDARAAREAAERLLADVALADRADDVILEFSKGMKRKTLLAAALVHDPEVLVLDEPLEGLDVIAQARFKEMLRERVARGRTVLYSTHILEVAEALCSHVALLSAGKVLACGTLDEVKGALGVGALIDAFVRERVPA
jgi:ABC-2 type transport system ATP-binding protein